MKRAYSKWVSIALITAIYVFAGIIGWLVFHSVMHHSPSLEGWDGAELFALFLADVAATVVVWAFGLLYENVSVYDPYWSVFPPVAFLAWAFYTGVWSLPVILLLIASWYWGWRLTRNWAITFKGIAHEDWRYTKYRSLHPALFHLINFFGLNMVPTLVVFAAMLPGLKLYEQGAFDFEQSGLSFLSVAVLILGCLVCLASATIQLIADKQSHDFRRCLRKVNENVRLVFPFRKLLYNCRFADASSPLYHKCGRAITLLFPLEHLLIEFSFKNRGCFHHLFTSLSQI
jgi:hypothetical protein